MRHDIIEYDGDNPIKFVRKLVPEINNCFILLKKPTCSSSTHIRGVRWTGLYQISHGKVKRIPLVRRCPKCNCHTLRFITPERGYLCTDISTDIYQREHGCGYSEKIDMKK
jgi:hypothetical protein